MKFRKKPVVIEAVRWHEDLGFSHDGVKVLAKTPAPEWLDEAFKSGQIYGQGGDEPYLTIKTLEGEMHAFHGDWIIRGIKGELYPCKNDIFQQTYEAAE